jgi:DhnA family fructose-bisphosphate aldolase class Ia
MKNLNWEHGISLRMSRLFNNVSGNSVVIAMDHGLAGAPKGLEDVGRTLEKVLAGQPDGVLLSGGAIRRFGSRLAGRNAAGLVMALDFAIFNPYPGSPEGIDEHGIVASPEEAVRLGVDMVKMAMIFGRNNTPDQARSFTKVGELIEKCHAWGLPVMVEPTTWGRRFDQKTAKDARILSEMARISAEFGADVVKTDYPENPADFEMIATACPVPLVVLGGTKKPTVEGLLSDTLEVMRNGASGVTFGRNAWQTEAPEKMVRAINQVVHHLDLPAALEELKK